MSIDQIVPRGFFRRRYDVLAEGAPVATLSTSESRSEFALEGRSYEIRREPGWGDFVLWSGDEEVARATKHSALKSTFTVRIGEEEYQLLSPGLGSSFELRHGEATVGNVRARGFFATRGDVSLPDDLTPAQQLFVLWLVGIMWARAEDPPSSPTV